MSPMQAPMSNDAADNAKVQIIHIPKDWEVIQDNLAAMSGLSLLLVDGRQPPALKVSNNNSICHAFQSSPTFNHFCEKYCGMAHKRVSETDNAEHYRCHAGLHCFVTPIESTGEKKLAVIGGRAFLQSSDYKRLIERLLTGDLKGLFNHSILQNVIFSKREKLDELLYRIQKTTVQVSQKDPKEKIEKRGEAYKSAIPKSDLQNVIGKSANVETGFKSESFPIEQTPASSQKDIVSEREIDKAFKEHRTSAERQTNPHNPYLSEETKRIYISLLKPLTDKFGFDSTSLLVKSSTDFLPVYVTGRFRHNPVHIQIDPFDERLFQAAKNETSIVLKPVQKTDSSKIFESSSQTVNIIELFPMIYHEDVLGVLLVGQSLRHATQRREVAAFCREAALQLEIIRLSAELERRTLIFGTLQRMAEQVNALEPSETYHSILDQSSELLRAERASLLIFDEDTKELEVKAASGPRAHKAILSKMRIGEGIAGNVLLKGSPIVAGDITKEGFRAQPERDYKTPSFISYPLIIGGRKLGVLNLTDKADGGHYDERDLKLIESIAPHIALAIGRAEWQKKAGEYELMSVTDPLTGLLNRRYLEERIDEEVKRSQRNNFDMSFLMIDIDDFKLYNDRYGHPAGDKALEITAYCLKTVLRADDIAVRYGGEEFSILLPQTALEEAKAIAERIRQKVEEETYPFGKITISIGVAAYSTMLNDATSIISTADRALFLAKSESKNTVKVLTEPHEIIPYLDATENSN